MKRLNELTEDEIIEDALRAVPEYLERIRTTGVFQLENCVAAETKRIEKLYKAGIGVRQYSPLRKKELQDMDAFTAHFIPLLMERTRPIQQRYMQQRRVSQINAITACTIIPEEFKRRGSRPRLAAIAIGPGAKCIDPVWHMFSYEGRYFFHNQDWGGVLEVPKGFLPEDDLWQAELSFQLANHLFKRLRPG